MSAMSHILAASAVRIVAEGSALPEKHNHPDHWLAGVVALAILLGAIGILLLFANGREHS
jgi:hypothetical protein